MSPVLFLCYLIVCLQNTDGLFVELVCVRARALSLSRSLIFVCMTALKTNLTFLALTCAITTSASDRIFNLTIYNNLRYLSLDYLISTKQPLN